jgi:hypothetical protein
LKRKVGYLDEELSMTKAKMSRMEIDTQQQQQREKTGESSMQSSAATKRSNK